MFLPFSHQLVRPALVACTAATLLMCLLTAQALESTWTEASHSQTRLLADSADGRPRAGVEIRLEKGWHTYWRYPGDSGVPPAFDWSGSENLASAAVQWPAPEVFVDESGMKSIGYHDRVIFPIAIKPADTTLPVKLKLKTDFAVCEKLCVPARAEMALDIPPETGDLSEILEQAMSAVPRKATLGESGALSITSIQIEHGEKPRAIIAVSTPEGTPPQLFAEGPDERWALPLPEKLDAGDGKTRFSLAFTGTPRRAKPIPRKLFLTLAAGFDAIEVEIPLE